MRTLLALGLAAALGLSLTACSHDTPVYGHPTACGVDAKLVTAAIGTDRFTVSTGKGTLPLNGDSLDHIGTYVCHVVAGDDYLDVLVQIADGSMTKNFAYVVRQLPQSRFTAGATRGAVGPRSSTDKGSVSVGWYCGRIVGSLSGVVGHWSQASVTAFAKGIVGNEGCWKPTKRKQ